MLKQIHFRNYKSFKDLQILELRPLTILIGKNSSGKSAIAKLPTMIEGSLSRNFEEPLLVVNEGVELGAEFRDLVYGREIGSLEFLLKTDSNSLTVEITSGLKMSELPRIRKWNLNEELHLTYDDKKRNYLNEGNDANYLCSFLGVELDKMINADNGELRESIPSLKHMGLSLKTNYVGPFRQIPDRTVNVTGPSRQNKIGINGENAYQILISDFLFNKGELLTKVSDWYKANFDGWGIDINTSSKPDYKVELTRDNPSFNVNIRDVGEGMSQALPLVVSAFLNYQEETLSIIEQPELHLHPAAHGNLAELFANAIKENHHHFLIETHSQNFILRLRRLIAEGKLNKDYLVIYSVDYDEVSNISKLDKITISDSGAVSSWPENVFSETLDETIAIRTAQIKKEKK